MTALGAGEKVFGLIGLPAEIPNVRESTKRPLHTSVHCGPPLRLSIVEALH